MTITTDNAGILFLLLLFLVIILAAVTVFMSMRLTRLAKEHKQFMKGDVGASLDRMIAARLDEVASLRVKSRVSAEPLDDEVAGGNSVLSHYGIVKYDAFNDVGGKMSFALALLDDSDSGFILNTIHSRDNCFQYIKEIVNGESYILLSREEVEALNRAIDHRDIGRFGAED